MTKDILLRAEHLTKAYDRRTLPALSDVSFTLERGEIAAVMGTSGSGKSTLLHILGGLLVPDGGDVQLLNVSIWDMKQRERICFRRSYIGFVEQDFRLLGVLNAYENIILPLRLNRMRADAARTQHIVAQLGLEECLRRYPHELSGGEQQRVAIARAAVTEPAILIADEPTGNLDKKNRVQVMEMLLEQNRMTGQTILFATHDQTLAEMADRVLTLSDGKLIADTRIRRRAQA